MTRTLRFVRNVSVALVLLLVCGIGSVRAQTYCTPQYTNGCNDGDSITAFSLTGAASTSFNQPATGCGAGGYQNYTALTPVSLIPCNTYSGSMTVGFGAQQIRIFIDFNNDGYFDSTASSVESVSSFYIQTSNVATSFSITIPNGVSAGTRRMRVRGVYTGSNIGQLNGPCQNYTYGETHDYTVSIGALAACSGTPVAGTAAASVPNTCPNLPFAVSLQGAACQSGLTYQLQTSTTGVPASYTNSGTSQTSPIFNITGITATTYYRIVSTCANGGATATSVADTVPVNLFNVCYCSPLTGTALHSFPNNYFSNVTIAGTTLNSSNGVGTNGYTQVPTTPASNTATISQGVTYTLTATYGTAGTPFGAGLWIDYDANGIFNQTTEYVPLTLGSTSATAVFTVPATATITSLTGLRVRAQGGTITSDPCANYFDGETEDYRIAIAAGTPCAGTPANGTAVASVASVCPNVPFTVALNGGTINQLGLSYQLQVSTTGATGSYSNTGTSQSTPTFSIAGGITATRYYRIVTTCANGGAQGTSVADTVLVNSATTCYCAPPTTVLHIAVNDHFTNVAIAGTTLNSSNGTNSSTGYLQISAPPASNTATMIHGTTYTLTATHGPQGQPFMAGVWIDFDANGIFSQTTEYFPMTITATNSTATFTVPVGSAAGLTGLRVRSRNGTITADACLQYGSGETEDYLVTLQAPVPCAGTPNAGTATANNTAPCPGNQVTVSISGGTIATGITYGIQTSTTSATTGFGATTATNATGTFTVTPAVGNNWYRIVTTCANGGATATSTAVQVVGGTPISTLPWNDGIESVTTTGTNNFPPCWKKINGDWQSADPNYTSTHDPRTGIRYLINVWTGTAEWMMTPGFQLTGGTSYDFSFYWVGDSYSGWDGIVGVNNIQDTTGATVLGTPFVTTATTTTTNYQQVIRTYVPSTSGVYFFGVRVGSNGNPIYLGFDDFRVNVSPTCPQPVVLPPTAITATGATLNWSPAATAPGIGYQWEVRTSGNPGTGGTGFIAGAITGPTVTSATTNALAGNTNYTVYVRAICTAGDSSLWSSTTFTTICPASFNLPFTENFVNPNLMPPLCWTADRGGLTSAPTALQNVGYSGWYSNDYLNGGTSNAATANIWYIGTQREWLISPTINLGTTPGNYSVEFNFGVTQYSLSTPAALGGDDTVAVVVSTDNGATWSLTNAIQIFTAANTPVNPTGTPAPAGGQRFYVPMNGYSGQVKIGFYGSNGTVVNGTIDNEVFIDSVRVISTCTPPSIALGNDTVVCGNIASYVLNAGQAPAGATYSWSNSFNTATGNTQTYDVAPVVNALDANPNPLANIISFYSTVTVSPGCSKTDTIVVGVNYSPRVTGISATPAGTSTNAFNFTPVGEDFATSFTWNFGDGGVSSIENPSHTYNTSGTYTVRLIVTNGCGSDTVTTTVTATNGIGDALAGGNAVNIFPNPTAADAMLEVTGGATLHSYQVMSATGAVVQDRTIKAKGVTSTTLNTHALAPGIYTLRIQLDKGVVVRKLEVLK